LALSGGGKEEEEWGWKGGMGRTYYPGVEGDCGGGARGGWVVDFGGSGSALPREEGRHGVVGKGEKKVRMRCGGKLCAWEAGYANEYDPSWILSSLGVADQSCAFRAGDANGMRCVSSRCRR